ncbi:MAG: ABC transporter ATP-binding protein/permease [Lachnospiraceae bacterium]|nr:ABC transporter ATP-binding protein/permease [Lachnospiraceae bacterium]
MKAERKPSNYDDVIRIFRMVRGFSKMLAASSIIRIVNKLSSVTVAVALAVMVVDILSEGTGNLIRWIVAFLIMLLMVVVLSYMDTYISHDVSFKIVKQLQNKMYDHMDRIAPGGLAGINSVDSAAIILNDINVFEWFVAHCLVEWIGTFTTLLLCLLMLCKISLMTAAVVLIFLIAMFVIPFLSTKQAKQKGLMMKRLFGELNGIVADGVSGHKDIIAFHWTDSFFSKLAETSETYSHVQGQFAMRGEWERTLEAAVGCLGILFGVMTAYFGLPSDHLLYLLPIFALCTATVGCIQDTLSESTNFGFVFGAAARMVKVFDIKAPVEDTGHKEVKDIENGQGTWELSVEHIAFQYPGQSNTSLLQDISFRVRSPEVVAIVAASGGGKSTVAKLLQRFWDVDKGSIRINGTDIREMKLSALRDIVTVVPQDAYLFHGSLKDNLVLVKPSASDTEINEALQLAQASFVNLMDGGLDTAVGENGAMLSGGECQRIALAQAFLINAPILVLDEATSALDTENEQKINEAIRTYRNGKITIVIAHRLSSIKAADNVIFIKDGMVFQSGTYNKLINECNEFRNLVRGEYHEES